MAEGRCLKDSFNEYCPKKDGKMTSKDFTEWCTDAKIKSSRAGDAWHSNNIDITFASCKTKGKNFVTYDQCEKLIDDLCAKCAKESKGKRTKEQELESKKEKLTQTSKRATIAAKTSKMVSKDDATKRMTDTTKYTGAHKERFDAEGKGKGSDGRVEKVDDSGYVGAYKEKDTYDKKH